MLKRLYHEQLFCLTDYASGICISFGKKLFDATF